MKKYAASRGKESRRLSMIILVYLHMQNMHFCPLCSCLEGSRLPKLRGLLKGFVCVKYVLEACSTSHRVLEVCVKSMQNLEVKKVDI